MGGLEGIVLASPLPPSPLPRTPSLCTHLSRAALAVEVRRARLGGLHFGGGGGGTVKGAAGAAGERRADT
jgi:hypothetical protein